MSTISFVLSLVKLFNICNSITFSLASIIFAILFTISITVRNVTKYFNQIKK